MAENGLLKKFEEENEIFDICAQEKLKRFQARPLSISDVMAVFVILLAGLLTAVVIILLEYFINKINNIPCLLH